MKNNDIVCFINSLSSGGAERQLSALSNQLVQRGYNVSLVTFGDLPDHYVLNDKVKRVRLAERHSRGVKFLRLFLFFLFCKADNIICYGQRESTYALFFSLFRLRKSNIIACERSSTLNGKVSKYEPLLFNFLYRFAKAIVCNSNTQKKYIENIKPEYKNKLYTIINYIDLDAYKPQSYPKNDIIKIGIFARYIKLKNFERLVTVVASLKSNGYKLCIEWYGNKHTIKNELNPEYTYLKELIKQAEIEDCFILNDHVKSVAAEIQKFDAVCLASLWEGFPNSVAEGICCGRPMIVSDVSDNSIMVQEGKNGFMFNPLDVDDMKRAFEQFLNLTYEQRYRMGQDSRRIAELLFDKNVFIDSYVDLLEKK